MAKNREPRTAPEVNWLDGAEEHDFPAAASYLSLLADASLVETLVGRLRSGAATEHFKAKDLLRAAGLPLLPPTNPHVASDLAKVAKGAALSPILLVRGDLARGLPLQIADGYHRVCACYHTDENLDLPAVLVDR
jgi:hypothetical protein